MVYHGESLLFLRWALYLLKLLEIGVKHLNILLDIILCGGREHCTLLLLWNFLFFHRAPLRFRRRDLLVIALNLVYLNKPNFELSR